MTTLAVAFAQAAKRHHDRIALVDGSGTAHRFSDLQTRANSYAALWQAKGVRPGDRVLIAMGIGVDLYASLAALWQLGATVVLPEPAMGLAGVKTAIHATQPKFLCASGHYLWLKALLPGLWGAGVLRPSHRTQIAPPTLDVDAHSTALISFTSGTTGTPKAIPRSHAFLMAQWDAVAPLLHSDNVETDLVTFPVFVLINLAEGRTSVLPNWNMSKLTALDPTSLSHWISTTQSTRALLPPALCEKLVEAGDTGGLTHVFTGGGPVFPDVVAGLKTITPDLRVTTVYGSTEAEPIAHADTSEPGYGLFAGRPVDAVQVRIVDTEIQVAGAHVNTGYLDTARDTETKVYEGTTIWHRTGDAGHLDDQGRLWLLGRIGDQVITAKGVQHPFAVETAARMWPGVKRVALIAQDNTPVLAIEGDEPQADTWKTRAADFGIDQLRHLASIPLDRRHNSKVDRIALHKLLSKSR